MFNIHRILVQENKEENNIASNFFTRILLFIIPGGL